MTCFDHYVLQRLNIDMLEQEPTFEIIQREE